MVKFITIRGTRALSATPYYIGIPQHERIMSRREAYALAATALANNTTGAEHACEVAYSDLGNVKVQLVSPLEAARTRSRCSRVRAWAANTACARPRARSRWRKASAWLSDDWWIGGLVDWWTGGLVD